MTAPRRWSATTTSPRPARSSSLLVTSPRPSTWSSTVTRRWRPTRPSPSISPIPSRSRWPTAPPSGRSPTTTDERSQVSARTVAVRLFVPTLARLALAERPRPRQWKYGVVPDASMLTPYRVLDLTDGRAELATFVLAGLGADVVKVEPPGGSPSRSEELSFLAFNRGKRSVVIDVED